MSPNQSPTTSRRQYLKVAGAVALGGVILDKLVGGFVGEAGKEAYGYVKGLIAPGAAGRQVNEQIAELLFGGLPAMTGIVPPGTNRHALAEGRAAPSRYMRQAYEAATGVHKTFAGVEHDVGLDLGDARLRLATHKNLLVLGGPVATELTRYLCGYQDWPSPREAKLVPIPRTGWPLPYYFYVGNKLGYGRWGSEYRSVIRTSEQDIEAPRPLYGIRSGPNGRPVPPPLAGPRVAGDMMMITRVPNPHNSKGVITLIGGLHGSSIESFFNELPKVAAHFRALSDNYGHDYFQALLPYRIESTGKAVLDLSATGDWSFRMAKVEGAAYLARFPALPSSARS